MSDRKLQLQVLFNAVDKLSAPLKHLKVRNIALAKAARETRQQIRQLEEQAGKVAAFQKLQKSVTKNGEALKEARLIARDLGRQLREAKSPSAELTQAFKTQRESVRQLARSQKAEQERLNALRAALYRAGVSAKDDAGATDRLAARTAHYNRVLQAQNDHLKRNGELQRRYQKMKDVRNNLAVNGAGMMAVGGGVLASAAPALHAATEYQQEIAQFKGMGVGDGFLQQAQKYADGMNIIGSSSTENLRTIKEAYSILRHGPESLAIAPTLAQIQVAQKMLMASGTVKAEGQEEQNADSQALVKVAELLGHITSTKDFADFANLAMKANAASGGLVNARDYRAVLSTGGVALNRIDPRAFFFSLSHLIQEKGGDRTGTGLASAYQNMVMGRETKSAAEEQFKIGLIKPGAIQYTKTGQLAKVRPDSIVNSALYRTDPYQYLMTEIVPRIRKRHPKLSEAGMEMAIAKLYSSRTAQDIMVTMYKQRANIDKQIAAGNAAQNTQQILHTNRGSAVGQQLNLAAQRANLNKQIGADLMPAYVAALKEFAQVLHRVTTEMRRHPRLAKDLVIALAGIGTAAAAFGGLALALAMVLSPLAAVRYALGMFKSGRLAARELKLLKAALAELTGVGGGAAKKTGLVSRALRGLWGLGKRLPGTLRVIKEVVAVLAKAAWLRAAGMIARAARILSGAFRIARLAVMAFGESLWALMANPIVAAIAIAIAALGLAAYEMWKHWDRVKPALLAFWKVISDAVGGSWEYLKKKWHEMVAWLEGLPATLKALGGNLISALMKGIDEKWQALKNKISGLADMLPDWMKPDGDKHLDGPGAPAGAPRPATSYAPLRFTPAHGLSYGEVPAPVVVHVHPSPGMNEKALGQHVANAVEKNQRRQRASARSRLADTE